MWLRSCSSHSVLLSVRPMSLMKGIVNAVEEKLFVNCDDVCACSTLLCIALGKEERGRPN